MRPVIRKAVADHPKRSDLRQGFVGVRCLGCGHNMCVGSPRAGQSLAALLSLIQTCRAMDIRPQEYPRDISGRLLDFPIKDLADPLPDRW